MRDRNYPIASTGTAYGSGAELIALISEAENTMYADKQIFHKEYPQYTRKSY